MHIPGTFAILVVNQILPLQILRHISNLYIVRLPIKTVTVVANKIYIVQIWQIILKINIVGLPTNIVLFVKIPTNSTKSIPYRDEEPFQKDK